MKNKSERYFNIFIILLLLIGAVIMMMPFLWMFLTSLKEYQETLIIPFKWLPENILNFKNYSKILMDYNFKRFFLNSAIVAFGNTFLTILFSSLTGYAFSKYKFPFKEAIFFILVITVLIVPQEAILIPQLILATKLKIVNTYIGLMMPGMISAFGVFVIRQFCDAIPDDYIEAARIDGFSEFRIFWNLIFPLLKPAIATIGIIKFIWSWNEFMWPLVIVNSEKMKTVTLGLTVFISDLKIDFSAISAGSFLSVLPMLIVFIFFQKYIIKAMVLTGLK